MVLAALAMVAVLFQGGQDLFPNTPIRQDILTNRDNTEPRLMIRQPQGPLPTAKKTSRTVGDTGIPYEFDWITWGFVKRANGEQHDLRFRVYSQEHKPEGDTGLAVTRMLLRLWDLNKQRLKLDHHERFYFQLVNVHLTWGGKAGGEQFTSGEIEGGKRVLANNIYLYDLASFNDPLEMAREVAHEYGHATLPAVGSYRAPETWANGYLGEKLYMTWIRDLLAKNLLTSDDFMGVKLDQADKWVRENVDPLVVNASATLPTMALLADRSVKGMDSYIGLTLYMSQILPDAVFARSLKLTSQDAREYLSAISLAVEEQKELTLRIPESLKGKTVWVPTGKGAVTGAKILALQGGWAQVQLGDGAVVIKARA